MRPDEPERPNFRQRGGRRDSVPEVAAGGAAADGRPGGRAARHDRALPASDDRGAAHPVCADRPSCAHPRVGAARSSSSLVSLSRSQAGPTGGPGYGQQPGPPSPVRRCPRAAIWPVASPVPRPGRDHAPGRSHVPEEDRCRGLADPQGGRDSRRRVDRPGFRQNALRGVRVGLDRGTAQPSIQDDPPVPVPAARIFSLPSAR